MVTIAQFDLFIGAYVTSTFVSSSEKTFLLKNVSLPQRCIQNLVKCWVPYIHFLSQKLYNKMDLRLFYFDVCDIRDDGFAKVIND